MKRRTGAGFCCDAAFGCRPAYYKIIEECVSQIVLHKSGLDPDFSKKHFNVDLQSLIDELKGGWFFGVCSEMSGFTKNIDRDKSDPREICFKKDSIVSFVIYVVCKKI